MMSSSTSPSPDNSTLYSSSPHAPIDKREARRRLKAQHRAGHYSDPTYITLLVLALALLYWFLPIPGVYELLYSRRKHTACSCSTPKVKLEPTMPWQKQFTLSSRSKGCHLVTNEVMPHLEEGLKGTKIGILTLFIQHTSAALSLNENFDRDVRSDMDMVSRPPLEAYAVKGRCLRYGRADCSLIRLSFSTLILSSFVTRSISPWTDPSPRLTHHVSSSTASAISWTRAASIGSRQDRSRVSSMETHGRRSRRQCKPYKSKFDRPFDHHSHHRRPSERGYLAGHLPVRVPTNGS